MLALVSCLLLAQAGRADTPSTHEPLLILTEQGSKDAEDAAFFSSVRALAAEIGISVTTEEVPTFQAVKDALLTQAQHHQRPFLVAWILRESNLRRIQLFDSQNSQLRTRTIEAGTSATANAEALALILRAELLAHLHQTPVPPQTPAPPQTSVSSPTPPAPPAQPPPAPPPDPEPPTTPAALSPRSPPTPPQDAQWAVATSYALGTFLRGQGLQQVARVGILHLWRHARVGLAYSLSPGQEVTEQDAVITIHRHPVHLDVGYASREYGRLQWIAETLLLGDWVTRHTSLATSPLLAQPDAGHLLVSVGARGRQELRLFRNLSLGLALGMEVSLNPIEFQIARGTTATTVARLSPVRFSVELGLQVSAL